MSDDLKRRERLGQAVKRRRLQLGLSVSAAAATARVDRGTWAGIEAMDRRMQEHNYASVEKALAWAPGSIEQVLAGADPENRDQAQRPVTIDDLPADLQRLIDLFFSPELTDREREDILVNIRMAYRGTVLSMRQRAEGAEGAERRSAPARRRTG